jgi:hypothetical protein
MNIPQVIMHLYPEAIPMKDFIVQDDSDGNGVYIAVWNIEDDIPTEEEMVDAWNEIQALPIPEPPETDAEKIARLEEEKAFLEERVSATEEAIMALMDLGLPS